MYNSKKKLNVGKENFVEWTKYISIYCKEKHTDDEKMVSTNFMSLFFYENKLVFKWKFI